MMKTPICEFVRNYCRSDTLRLHMPGHKGIPLTGPEAFDITEIEGADSLYEAHGIIQESEENAATLFETGATLYSAEGSSQCIRAMLYLALLHAKRTSRKPLILAARNVHKTFVTAVGLLDIEVDWLLPRGEESYLSCSFNMNELEARLSEQMPTALYITSPDYLGNCTDIVALATLCRRYGVLLLVDNAHGAYLKFLPRSAHPIDLGADLCCDSAHKTLPALTGAAYLHLSRSAPDWMLNSAKGAMALFGSTSPSYLILQSLDAVNAYLADGYRQRLCRFMSQVDELKKQLTAKGYRVLGNEPLKLTLAPKAWGYSGTTLAELLAKQGIVCEFADEDFVVLMLSCELGEKSLTRISVALCSIEHREPILTRPPTLYLPQRVMSVRNALLCAHEYVPVEEAEGRVLASLNVSCPPAVPIAVCGEQLDRRALELFAYYGIKTCCVLCKDQTDFSR